MPNIKSSVLSVRKDAKTNAANTAKKSEMRTAIKKDQSLRLIFKFTLIYIKHFLLFFLLLLLYFQGL